jgi:hypothetical protein
VNRKRADKCDPKDASALLSVKQCGIHLYYSKEEDTPPQKNLGRNHDIAVGKQLHDPDAAGHSARRLHYPVAIIQQSSSRFIT